MQIKIKKIKITIRKDEKGIFLFLKAPIEIEEFFKGLSNQETQQSEKWLDENKVGHNFYKITDELNSKLRAYNNSYFNDFGDGLVKNRDYINIAPLRAVGISQGIRIYHTERDLITNSEIDYYLKQLGEFIKRLWADYISEKTIKAIISLEI